MPAKWSWPGEKLLAMRCLHLADGRPLALEHRLISPVGVPEVLEVDFSTTAPGSWLLQNVSWTRAQHRISAWGADTATARLLDVKPGTACLVIERLTWRGEQPITRVRQVFLGDAWDLVARFAPGRGRGVSTHGVDLLSGWDYAMGDSVDPRHAWMLPHQYVAHCRQRTGSSTPGRALSWMRTLRRAG
jgi:hypothetical protein